MTTISNLLAVLSLLLLFGFGYNYLVAEMERRKFEGYTWAQVVIGVAVCVSAAALVIGLGPALIVLACLAAGGLPMIAGAIFRHEQKVRAMLRRLKAWAGEPRVAGDE